MLTNWSAAAASAVNHQLPCSIHSMACPHSAVPESAVLCPVPLPLLSAAPAATSLVLPSQSKQLRKDTKNHSRDTFILRTDNAARQGGNTGGVLPASGSLSPRVHAQLKKGCLNQTPRVGQSRPWLWASITATEACVLDQSQPWLWALAIEVPLLGYQERCYSSGLADVAAESFRVQRDCDRRCGGLNENVHPCSYVVWWEAFSHLRVSLSRWL